MHLAKALMIAVHGAVLPALLQALLRVVARIALFSHDGASPVDECWLIPWWECWFCWCPNVVAVAGCYDTVVVSVRLCCVPRRITKHKQALQIASQQTMLNTFFKLY